MLAHHADALAQRQRKAPQPASRPPGWEAAIVDKYRVGGPEHRRSQRIRQANALGVGWLRLRLRLLADWAAARRQGR